MYYEHQNHPKMILIIIHPFSVLSITSKIIERHVHDCFYSYLSENDVLSDVQSGFRNFNSITSMIDDWIYNVIYYKLDGCIILDFRKAFDILSHGLILRNLSLCGCDDIALQWF